jgi:hypothetical protein
MGFEEIAKALIVYGPLGIFCVVFLIGYYQERKRNNEMQKEFLDKQEALMRAHQDEMKAMSRDHQDEMNTLEERYISKAETWMEKYREQKEGLQKLVEGLMAHGGRRSGG